jgi:hypothetical protein
MPQKSTPISAMKYLVPLLHDWRDSEQYAYTQELNFRQWAWEFLRRNVDYQTDWLKAVKKAAADGTLGENSIFCEEPFKPPVNNIESLKKWHIDQYIDPRIERNPGFSSWYPIQQRIYYKQGITVLPEYDYGMVRLEIPKFDKKNMAICIVDISKEITPQIKLIQAKLQKLQKNKPKPRKLQEALYPKYIQLLDAVHSENTTREEIVSVLYEPNLDDNDPIGTYKRQKRAALSLCQGGYQQLLFY